MPLWFELARLALVGVGAYTVGTWVGHAFNRMTYRRRNRGVSPIIED